jgi:hypothetical protein
VAAGLLLVSGGEGADPRTPAGLPGKPPPFLGTVVIGNGGPAAAIDAYGDVVDLRQGPAGPALIDNPADRQAAGTVPADTGIVPRVSIDGGPALPIWRADSVSQGYLAGTNVVSTVARFGRVVVTVTDAAEGASFARRLAVKAPREVRVGLALSVNVDEGARCDRERRLRAIDLICSPVGGPIEPASVRQLAEMTVRTATLADRNWLGNARPLSLSAPRWAAEMYRRSLLTLRALTDSRSGAVAAGARDGWAYVWPRDAGAAALAFAAAGYRSEARRVAGFLLGLDLGAAARFEGDGAAVEGREAQGDAAGWTAVAAQAAGIPPTPDRVAADQPAWRGRPDYQEGSPGDYLANAIASASVDGLKTPLYGGKSSRRSADGRIAAPGGGIAAEFGGTTGLARAAEDPGSGLDSAAAWAVRPFALPALYPEVQRTLLHLAAQQTPFGITPGEGWTGGGDPWTAPTAWTAWSLAALSDWDRSAGRLAVARDERRQALRLVNDLGRAATPAGVLPERVDARTGMPRSTTPLAWSHAFAILALRELWPGS